MPKAIPKPLANIDSPDNLRLHRLGWRAQRIFQVLLLLFVVVAALGAFGTGIFSHREQRLGTALLVQTERMARESAVTELDIQCLQHGTGRLVVVLPNSLADCYHIENVWPQPLAQASLAAGLRYEFAQQAGSRVVFTFRPQKPGQTHIALSVNDAAVDFSQTIFP